MQTQITVLENVEGKFGPQLKDAKGYLSFGKFYKGPKEFPAGTLLDVELYVTEKGSRYINKGEMVGMSQVSGSVVPPPSSEPAKRGRKPNATKAPADEVMKDMEPLLSKKVDWDELGRGKTASLFVAAMLQNPNMVQSLEDVNVDKMEPLVWELVDLVFKTRKENV